MTRAARGCRPATVLYFPLAMMATSIGLIFGLQLVGLLILVDLELRRLATPYEGDGPVLAEIDQVRIANHPPDWAPIRGVRAEAAGADDLLRAFPVVLEELGKYRGSVLRRAPLRRVVLCANLTGRERRVGGVTLDGRGVILLDVGLGGPAMGGALRRAIHHEMSHILDDALPHAAERDDQWSRLNPTDFAYGGDEIVRALETLGEDPGGRPDAPGFLTYYAMVSPREDRAELFAAMMIRPEGLRFAVAEDPILRAKCRFLRAELVGWNPGFADILVSP